MLLGDSHIGTALPHAAYPKRGLPKTLPTQKFCLPKILPTQNTVILSEVSRSFIARGAVEGPAVCSQRQHGQRDIKHLKPQVLRLAVLAQDDSPDAGTLRFRLNLHLPKTPAKSHVNPPTSPQKSITTPNPTTYPTKIFPQKLQKS